MSKDLPERRTGACPLCERDNCCGLVTPGATGCWCYGERVPAGLLRQVPPIDQGRRCVCQACVRAHKRAADPLRSRLWQLLRQIRRNR